ncbi:energy-coupled thiamine transporter ThiT [Fundicoccus culcitae]|uniref:Energy-coupled thiamine transporter ThiT n=1 Tax=Fundicoccus culcitae TaxID=2969821 RepID=A0ABY5P5Q7_9LACT|nr:energy-coupled thiamine transporter ThiT [Fundicoccus culcitae]UUX34074.1 energy-coupled thiamine transporter ThiT [Fundicoccus culcitae]
MNRRTRQLLTDALIAIVLSTVLTIIFHVYGYNLSLVTLHLEWSIIPIIWFAFRQGPAATVMVGLIQGLISGLIIWNTTTVEGVSLFMFLALYQVLPYISLAVAGLFAKYTQKTLNNRRLSSTYLNIVTGSILAVLAFYLLCYGIIPYAFGEMSEFTVLTSRFWISVGIISLVTIIILCMLARWKPQAIIPKRSQYLSRKETSSLLND